jgi:hypothetical protein
MSYTKVLEDFAGSNNTSIANWAKDVLSLDKDFKAKKISESEYKELLSDLVHSKAISQAADDLAVKTKLNECIENIASVVGLVI